MDKNLTETLADRLNRTFITDRLLQDTLSDALQRALILVFVMLVSALSAFFLSLTFFVLFAVTGEPLLLLATAIAVVTMSGYLATLWIFRRQQALLPAANLYALTTIFSTVAPCLITGGVSTSPYLSVVLVMPIFLYLIAGRTYGMYWSLIALACVSALFALESFGVEFPQIIPAGSVEFVGLVAWIMTLFLLVIGLSSYEASFEQLTNRITEERGQFAHEAMHDPLTGLSNRKLFFSRAQEAVEHAMGREHKAAVIFIDLDDFKLINDGFGHDTGDDVLNAVAQRLQDHVRSVDTVARLGGDEFAIVLHGIERAEIAEFMVEKLREVMREPFHVGEHSLHATGSIGLAVAPDQGQDVGHLLRTADQAMYRAKEVRDKVHTGVTDLRNNPSSFMQPSTSTA